MLFPEWTVLTDFTPIAVNDNRFGMTKLLKTDVVFEAISNLRRLFQPTR
jgi:hypothetical protein